MVAPEVVRQPLLELGPRAGQRQVGAGTVDLPERAQARRGHRGLERLAHGRGGGQVAQRDAVPARLRAKGAEEHPRELRFAAGFDHEVEEVRAHGAARADELELADAEAVEPARLDLERRGRDQAAVLPHEHDAGLDLGAVDLVPGPEPVPREEDGIARGAREEVVPFPVEGREAGGITDDGDLGCRHGSRQGTMRTARCAPFRAAAHASLGKRPPCIGARSRHACLPRYSWA